ncbi:MAG: sigma-54 dependent transcriptional regulator [Candidatus Goldiibacteriota bacterium]
MGKILVALTDKDDAIRINNFFDELSYSPYIVTDSGSLMNKIQSNFKLLILDIDIVEELELDIINFIKRRTPSLKVVVVSGREKINKAIEMAGRAGFAYISKPINLNEIKYLAEKAFMEKEREEDMDALEYFENRFVGNSEKIRKVTGIVKKVASNNSNILITGETGTGKELIARALYEMSGRSNNPFIAVNSAAIPENLLESELFGYRKGAFTGAVSDKKGLIELADKGTLFLDEIGDLSLGLQAKLLRTLEYREVRRLGDENTKKVDIRVIAATNQDLKEAIKEKRFREDLFFRLNVIHIEIPPLRERKDDIPVLVRFFIEKYNKLNKKNIMGIEQKAKAILMYYDYPGNVREMENIIQHAFALSNGDYITVEDLPVHLQNITPYRELEAYNPDSPESGEKDKNIDDEFNLAEVEKRVILKAFERFGKNHTKISKALGVSRSTLWRKIKDYKLVID